MYRDWYRERISNKKDEGIGRRGELNPFPSFVSISSPEVWFEHKSADKGLSVWALSPFMYSPFGGALYLVILNNVLQVIIDESNMYFSLFLFYFFLLSRHVQASCHASTNPRSVLLLPLANIIFYPTESRTWVVTQDNPNKILTSDLCPLGQVPTCTSLPSYNYQELTFQSSSSTRPLALLSTSNCCWFNR